MMAKPYDIPAVVTAVLASLESTMRTSTPELIIEAILEGYRQAPPATTIWSGHPSSLRRCSGRLRRRQAPAGLDVAHVANVAQSLVSEGARHWAIGYYGDRSYAEVVGCDIAALVAGYSA